MTEHTTTEDLCAAIKAALPDLTDEQVRQARNLLIALTPAMEEPKWPGAPVIAACSGGLRRLHVRRNDGPDSRWECDYSCTSTPWHKLIKPRPLTSEEYDVHRIPMPCTHPSDGETR